MSKVTTKVLFLALIIIGLSGSSLAQDQMPIETQKNVRVLLINGENSAVVDANGRLTQIEIPPTFENGGQVLQLGYDSNGLSSVTDSNGATITIQRNEVGEIQGYIFPDGATAVLNLSDCETPITFNIKNINAWQAPLRPYPRGGGGGNVCRDAAAAAVIAIGVCAANGSWTPACWGLTANAAYQAYKCWESTQ